MSSEKKKENIAKEKTLLKERLSTLYQVRVELRCTRNMAEMTSILRCLVFFSRVSLNLDILVKQLLLVRVVCVRRVIFPPVSTIHIDLQEMRAHACVESDALAFKK